MKGYNVRVALSFVVIPLALLLSPACSRKTETGAKEAEEKPAAKLPPGAMSLSAVLKSVEGAGYAPVTEVEFEDDHWQIKAYHNGQLVQLKVGLVAGDILPDAPPTLEKPLSAVVKTLEDQGYGPFVDVERETGGSGGGNTWEVEAYKGSSEVTVTVEAGSGKITPK